MSTTRFAIACVTAATALLTSPAARALDQEAIQREVAGMNDSLPAMVSPVLREEKVRFNGAELSYTFTRVGTPPTGANGTDMAMAARSYLLNRLCDDPDTRQMMRDGIVFSFGYADAAGAEPNRLLINESDCAVIVPGR